MPPAFCILGVKDSVRFPVLPCGMLNRGSKEVLMPSSAVRTTCLWKQFELSNGHGDASTAANEAVPIKG